MSSRIATRALPRKTFTRSLHDLQIPPSSNTGRSPIVSAGPGGRSSVTGHVATVFGATGFLGRYLVSKLARRGTQVIVAYRDPDDARHLKVTGDLGVVIPMEFDARNDYQIEECVRHSDVVYNLIGRDYETKNFGYNSVFVETSRRLARISALTGVRKFIQVSHLNADPDSKSQVYRAKYEGEAAVMEAFENATIVRPGPMYGHEDRFINSMVRQPWSWRVNHGQTLTRPVHVLDVAQALFTLESSDYIGPNSLFTLPGPKAYTHRQLQDLLSTIILPKKPLSQGFAPSKSAFILYAKAWEKGVWFPTWASDDVRRRFINDKGTEVSEGPYVEEPGHFWQVGLEPVKEGMVWRSWADLNIEPEEFERLLHVYCKPFMGDNPWEGPAEGHGLRLKRPKYTVIP
ncbi:NAD(P)-binding protein [Atractiella rhizophila]|nr:NAD(P)-binding protein [Atractiella rhizophila]